jgi:predicted RNA binding protein YcfA (HicA-like mRNA interferase family)
MGRFYLALKTSRLIRALKKLGFTVEHAKKHDIAYLKSGTKTMIPRTTELKKGTAENICKFVIEQGGISEEELFKLLT